jgi:hypothetical protein
MGWPLGAGNATDQSLPLGITNISRHPDDRSVTGAPGNVRRLRSSGIAVACASLSFQGRRKNGPEWQLGRRCACWCSAQAQYSCLARSICCSDSPSDALGASAKASLHRNNHLPGSGAAPVALTVRRVTSALVGPRLPVLTRTSRCLPSHAITRSGKTAARPMICQDLIRLPFATAPALRRSCPMQSQQSSHHLQEECAP